jgi:hypothetical protein
MNQGADIPVVGIRRRTIPTCLLVVTVVTLQSGPDPGDETHPRA